MSNEMDLEGCETSPFTLKSHIPQREGQSYPGKLGYQ